VEKKRGALDVLEKAGDFLWIYVLAMTPPVVGNEFATLTTTHDDPRSAWSTHTQRRVTVCYCMVKWEIL
jgi:hypothetical protein